MFELKFHWKDCPWDYFYYVFLSLPYFDSPKDLKHWKTSEIKEISFLKIYKIFIALDKNSWIQWTPLYASISILEFWWVLAETSHDSFSFVFTYWTSTSADSVVTSPGGPRLPNLARWTGWLSVTNYFVSINGDSNQCYHNNREQKQRELHGCDVLKQLETQNK